LIDAFDDRAEGPVMTVFCECRAHIDTPRDSIVARRNGYALIEQRSDRLSRKAISEEGADITSDDKLVRTLILLLAACEQTANELKQADAEVDGLGGDLETLIVRLRDLLDQDRWKTLRLNRPTPAAQDLELLAS
jgi:hypothetical protein